DARERRRERCEQDEPWALGPQRQERREDAAEEERLGGADRVVDHPARRQDAEEGRRPQGRGDQLPADQQLVEQDRRRDRRRERRQQQRRRIAAERERRERADEQRIERQVVGKVRARQIVRDERVIFGHLIQRLGDVQVRRAVPVA